MLKGPNLLVYHHLQILEDGALDIGFRLARDLLLVQMRSRASVGME